MTAVLRIHRPPIISARKARRWCPTCRRRTTMHEVWYEWYGWHTTCLSCGEQWQDGEQLPRPFMPAWRKRNIDGARRMMRKAQAQ